MKIEEIRIPAPWGHIAAKAWGCETNEPVIITHGFQDNAGSFDRLVPLLPKCFYYVCVDLPGHGLSSHFHKSAPVHYVDFLLVYKIVVDYFKRTKYILMGHSFGGTLSLFFTQLYPTIVSKLIIIDAVYALPIDPDVFLDMLYNAHTVYFKNVEQRLEDRPTYTYEEIVDKVMKNRFDGWLTYETAEDLAKRMIKPNTNGKYILTLDPKSKEIIWAISTVDYNIRLFKTRPVICPVLMLLMSSNPYTTANSCLLEHFKEAGFCVKTINDHHHVHHTNPEVVENDITNFLLHKHNKL